MIVTFALQADNPQFPSIPLAELTIASVRKFLPQAKIVQLSNLDFPMVEGVDEVLRRENKGDFIEWAFGSLISLIERGEPILQIATDVLLNWAPVEDVFRKEFDVAACRYPWLDRNDGAFCGDVNFINPAGLSFWRDVYDYYMGHPEIQDGWEGGQTAFLRVVQTKKHKILELDSDIYCFTPDRPNLSLDGVKIIHFRGQRKFLMPDYADKMELTKLFQCTVVGNVPEKAMEDNVRSSLKLPLEILENQYSTPKESNLLIVGGGPSLTECLGEISLRKRAGCIIWALNNSFRFLCEHGVTPDAHIMLDAREENIHFIPEKTETVLLYSAQCHPSVIEKGMQAGRVILWCPSILSILDILTEYKKTAAIIAGGSSVGLKAIALAHVFGFRNIDLYGYDSSYKGDENHAYPQRLNNKENKVQIKAGERYFLAAPWMVVQTQEFERSMSNFQKMGLNISVHGDGLLPHVARMMME